MLLISSAARKIGVHMALPTTVVFAFSGINEHRAQRSENYGKCVE